MSGADALLDFWFGALDADGVADEAHRRRWFERNSAFDAELEQRFGDQLPDPQENLPDPLPQSPQACLAQALLFDQLPRNLFRGQDKAFTWDSLARRVAGFALEQGFDRALGLDERAFLYLPFEHSERLLDQYLAVGLFTTLRDQAPKSQRALAGNYLRHAQQHRDTILRFGRFPYRNAALDRTSTAEEVAYLQAAQPPG